MPMTSGVTGGPTLQGVTPGWRKKILWVNLQRIVDKRGRAGKKVWATPSRGGDTRVKSISDSDEQKNTGHQFFGRK